MGSDHSKKTSTETNAPAQAKETLKALNIRKINDIYGNQFISSSNIGQLESVTIGYLRDTCSAQHYHSNLILSHLSKICGNYLEFLWSDCWDDTLCGTGITLNTDRMEAIYDEDRTESHNANKKYGDADYISGWYTVFGQNEIDLCTNGKYHWSFDVSYSTGSSNGQEIHIGIIGQERGTWSSKALKDKLKEGNKFHYSSAQKHHCVYSGRCGLYSTPVPGSHGKYLAHCNKIAQAVYDPSEEHVRTKSPLQFANIGDTFDIFMDCKNGTVEFAVNNVVYDPIWSGLRDDIDFTYRIVCSMVGGRHVRIKHFATDYEVVQQ